MRNSIISRGYVDICSKCLSTKPQQFTREWVAQEIGTDSPATVQWGSAKVDWKIVAEVSLILTTHTRRLRRHLKMPSHFASYLYKQFAGPPLGPEDFVRHLHYSRNRQATDLRDHVFAQTGHPSGRSPTTGLPIMKVDYSKSLPEVFKDATITLLEQCSALDVLNTVQHGPKLGMLDLRCSKGSRLIT